MLGKRHNLDILEQIWYKICPCNVMAELRN